MWLEAIPRSRVVFVMLRLGLCSGAYITRDAMGVIGAAVAARLEAIEWAADAHIGIGDRQAAERIMIATLSSGLTTASYSTLYRVGSEEGTTAHFDALLEIASILHAPIMRLYAWGNSVDAIEEANGRYGSKGFASRVAQFRRLGDRAAAKGITLCMSMGRGKCHDRYDRAVHLVESIDHDFVRVAWEDLPGAEPTEATAALNRAGRSTALLIVRCAARDGKPRDLVKEDWRARIQAYKHCEGNPKMTRFVLLGASRPEGVAGGLILAADASALRGMIAEVEDVS